MAESLAGELPAAKFGKGMMIGKAVVFVIVLASLLGNVYLIGLLRHSSGSFTQLRNGGTAAYPGLVTKSSATSISIQVTTNGKKSTKVVSIPKNTPYAIFPKNYQTLIPIGLPSSAADIVVGKTEASVSAQLPYLASAKALRINLVRDDMLTGKVEAVNADSIKFKAYAASGYVDQTLKMAANAPVQKLGTDGTFSTIKLADVKIDQGMYAYLNQAAGPDTAVIQHLIVADFTSSTK